jgi:anti-anti-sigma regulatory factor
MDRRRLHGTTSAFGDPRRSAADAVQRARPELPLPTPLRAFPSAIARPTEPPGLQVTVLGDTPSLDLQVNGVLTAHTARTFCRAVHGVIDAHPRRVRIDLGDVAGIDVIGVAVLLQATTLARQHGAQITLSLNAKLYRTLLDAEVLGEVPDGAEGRGVVLTGADVVEPRAAPAGHCPEVPEPWMASTGRLGLRKPAWQELVLFQRWANEPPIADMVGSRLLYACRHLGPYHPDFVRLVRDDVTSLTLLIEPALAPTPIGFVRLYGINLAEQFAFLETAAPNPPGGPRGLGIEASRLLIAYGMDVLGLCRVEAKVYAYNIASINALRRNGFEQEGVLRQARRHEGRRWDVFVFGILADGMRRQRARHPFPAMGLWTTSDAAPPSRDTGCDAARG